MPRASADRSDSNTDLGLLQTHAEGSPTPHTSGNDRSSIPPSVPFLQRLCRYNERDSLRKLSHCPPQNDSCLPLYPRSPPPANYCPFDSSLALARVPARGELVLLMA